MPIATQCPCGARFAAPDNLAGRKVKCPKCAQPVRVANGDASDAAKGATTGSPAAIGAKCQCGRSFKVPGKLAGKVVKCPECGEAVPVPDPVTASAAESAAAANLNAGDTVNDLLDEVELNLSKTGRRCPECRKDLQLDDILCIHCGYNTELGKKIKIKKLESGKRVGNVVLHEGGPAAGKKMPATVQSLIKLLNQAGILAILTAVLVIAFLGYQEMQADPNLGVNAFVSVLTSTGGVVLGAAILLVTIPCAVAANLVQNGKPAGRFVSMIAGFTSLLAVPIVTLVGILILKLAFSDDVAQYCR